MNYELLEEIKKDALENHVPILQDESLNVINTILDIKRPNRILEIGTAVGYSAINFSKYLSGDSPKITTIEIKKEMYDIAINNIEKMGLSKKIQVINADATTYLKEIKEEFDVIFIDAAKGQYLVYLEEAIRMAKDGAIIIADNVYFKGRVLSDYNEHKYRTATNRLRKYLDIISRDERLNSIVLNVGDGVAISVVHKLQII